MALLTPPRALPALGWATARFVALQGGEVLRSDVIRAVSPPTLGSDASEADDNIPMQNTIDAFDLLGVLSATKETVRLPPEAEVGLASVSDFADLVRQRVLSPALNEDIWEGSQGARDLT